ncbi:hypothetical protein NL676_018514 [Syzygium grande]|nr:hypothetical protein NL676_018514 [Syzygium grande]
MRSTAYGVRSGMHLRPRPRPPHACTRHHSSPARLDAPRPPPHERRRRHVSESRGTRRSSPPLHSGPHVPPAQPTRDLRERTGTRRAPALT